MVVFFRRGTIDVRIYSNIMTKIGRKIKTFLSKITTLFALLLSREVSKRQAFSYFFTICRYTLGQMLAYSGIGKFISFSVDNRYRLYLTRSPVAMVLFGDPTIIRDEEKIAQGFLHEGDVCLDIGANIGNFSLFASKVVGNTGKVFAFEAHPATYRYATRNIALNNMKNIICEQKAVGESQGSISFSNDSYDDVNHVQKGGGVLVEMITLDDYAPLSNNKVISFMKIDIEGYELFALKGATKLLQKTRYILFESYEKSAVSYGYHVEDVYSFFLQNGFDIIDPHTNKQIEKSFLTSDTIQNLLAVNKSLVSYGN